MSDTLQPAYDDDAAIQMNEVRTLVDPITGTEFYVSLSKQTEGSHGHEVDARIGTITLVAQNRGGLSEEQAIEEIQRSASALARAELRPR